MFSDRIPFEIVATDGAARRARLTLGRATVETPAFMPVGTRASVKTLLPSDVANLGYRLILANTYHLHLHPGEATVAALGGVQSMMGWEGAVLTDSGGYQVFSLGAMRHVTDHGVTFETELGPRFISPESAMQIQVDLGSDIAMAFDECPPIDAAPEIQHAATGRTHRWAERCLTVNPAPGQARFGIAQGGMIPSLRTESARFIASLPFDGFAIGGLSLGEKREATWEMTAAAVPFLPATRPRYLMGFGAPEDLINGVAFGVDLFDCVLPTRLARHGAVFTADGRMNLKNQSYAADPSPIEADCDCLACQHYSRGWIRQLLGLREPLGLRLASIHNLRHLARLMESVREAIETGTFEYFRRERLARLGQMVP